MLAHTLGWWAKALVLRHTPLLWLASVGFELCELSFRVRGVGARWRVINSQYCGARSFVRCAALGGGGVRGGRTTTTPHSAPRTSTTTRHPTTPPITTTTASTKQHLLPNFNECWWDSAVLDVALCNWLGARCFFQHRTASRARALAACFDCVLECDSRRLPAPLSLRAPHSSDAAPSPCPSPTISLARAGGQASRPGWRRCAGRARATKPTTGRASAMAAAVAAAAAAAKAVAAWRCGRGSSGWRLRVSGRRPFFSLCPHERRFSPARTQKHTHQHTQ